jgi:hypothetical protein
MSRSIKACMNCGETREIAAHGLCFRCYRQEERKIADDLWAKPDPTAKELAKTQRKTRKALMKMMDALEEIESGKLVPEPTTEQWRALLRPEIERIALSLGEAQVNGEHENIGEPFTESADEPGEQVNSEQERVNEQFTDPTSQGSEPVNRKLRVNPSHRQRNLWIKQFRVISSHRSPPERCNHPRCPQSCHSE